MGRLGPNRRNRWSDWYCSQSPDYLKLEVGLLWIIKLHFSMHQQTSANTNAFRPDPNGLKAHLFSFFFGPTYLPDNYNHLLLRGAREVLPPRFGPPAPHQVPWLPSGWTATEPPHYYGVPCPPYLPAPLRFDTSLFTALTCAARSRRSYDAWKSIPEEEIADGGQFLWFHPVGEKETYCFLKSS